MMLPAWIIDFFQPQGVKCLRCGMAYFDELNAGLCPMCARSRSSARGKAR